jgi:hypothetical protein
MLRTKTTRSRTKRFDARARPPGENAQFASGVAELSDEELDRRAWVTVNKMPIEHAPERNGMRKPK